MHNIYIISGNITDTVKARGMWNNTLLVFTTCAYIYTYKLKACSRPCRSLAPTMAIFGFCSHFRVLSSVENDAGTTAALLTGLPTRLPKTTDLWSLAPRKATHTAAVSPSLRLCLEFLLFCLLAFLLCWMPALVHLLSGLLAAPFSRW